MSQLIKGKVLNADGTSPLLDALKIQLKTAQQTLSDANTALASTIAKRGDCQRTGLLKTWDNGCLDDNTAEQARLRTIISDANTTISRLNGEIDSEFERITAGAGMEVSTDVDLLGLQADSLSELASISARRLLYMYIGIAIVILAISVLVYFKFVRKK